MTSNINFLEIIKYIIKDNKISMEIEKYCNENDFKGFKKKLKDFKTDDDNKKFLKKNGFKKQIEELFDEFKQYFKKLEEEEDDEIEESEEEIVEEPVKEESEEEVEEKKVKEEKSDDVQVDVKVDVQVGVKVEDNERKNKFKHALKMFQDMNSPKDSKQNESDFKLEKIKKKFNSLLQDYNRFLEKNSTINKKSQNDLLKYMISTLVNMID